MARIVHDELRAKVDDVARRHPCVALAVGIVDGGRLAAFHAHGLADIPSRRAVTEDTVVRFASISKTFTAVAVAQLWEQGLVDLDALANEYLRAYEIAPTRPGGGTPTVRQLLTHTGGVPEAVRPWELLRPDFGESVAPQYQPDPRIPGIGLGFFRTSISGHDLVEHQGTIPGFDSQAFLAPGSGTAVLSWVTGTRQGVLWLPGETAQILADVLEVPAGQRAPGFAHRPETWGDFIGWYRLSASPGDARLRGFLGFGAEVFIRGERLMLRFLGPIPALAKGFPLVSADADDPDVLRLAFDETGNGFRVVFGRDAAGRVDALHLDMQPVTLRKGKDAANPRRWASAALAVAIAAGAARPIVKWARR